MVNLANLENLADLPEWAELAGWGATGRMHPPRHAG